MKRIGTSIIISLFFLVSNAQQIGDTTRLHPNPAFPPNPAAIDIVILGDGYTEAQILNDTLFRDHAASLWVELINHTSPFTEYQNYFNIYRIDIASNTTGIDEPCLADGNEIGVNCDTVFYDTYFNTSFDGESFAGNVIDRLATANFDSVYSVLETNGFDTAKTFVFLLVNCEGVYQTYANHHFGGGYWDHKVAICPGASIDVTTSASVEDEYVSIHEFMHAFSQVLDEYWYFHSEDYATDTGNMSDTNHVPEVPWRNWLGYDPNWPSVPDIGVHSHVHLDPNETIEGWYKPTTGGVCKMEDVASDLPVCRVCREATIERIHGLAPAMYGHHPENSDPIDASEELTFSIDLIQTTNNTVVVEWWLNGDSITTNDGTWQLDCDAQGWNIGTNTLTAIVEDRTPFIRIDDHNDHVQSVSWEIEFNGSEADLWMRDLLGDDGNTAPPAPIPYGSYDHGPDLWVRNQTDGILEHENPSYAQDSVFVYARVFSRGCKTSEQQHQISTYFTLAGPANAWPTYFDGTMADIGNAIGTTAVGAAIATGDSAMVEFQ